MNQNQRPKSTNSLEGVAIRFVNKSKRNVDIIWLNYDGLPVKYFTLEPDHYQDMNTFRTHPWIFQDSQTKDKLVANSQDVFYPPNWLEMFKTKFPNRPPPATPPKIVVMITIPVYTLRERCLQVVRDSLNYEAYQYTAIDECLQLPKSVVDDLLLMMLKKDGFYISL